MTAVAAKKGGKQNDFAIRLTDVQQPNSLFGKVMEFSS